MSRPPDDIESEARAILYEAFYPCVVVVPTLDGSFAVIGPFDDTTAAWVWIDHYEAYLPQDGVAAISPLPPAEAIAILTDQGLL
jgi:hypothetical protein